MQISQTTAALAFLLVVVCVAALGRLWIAIAVAVASTFALNFFFLPSVGAFTIAERENWVALFAFVVVAVMASKLSTAAQDRAREAVARRNEVTRLFDLSRDVLLTTETTGALDALARHIARRFELPRVAMYLPADHGWDVHQGGDQPVTVPRARLNRTLATPCGTLRLRCA